MVRILMVLIAETYTGRICVIGFNLAFDIFT